ncbi:hypothetical protein [Nonomuraea ceibae]|uniref:hypothetical protein n=1 Tax=Nonomuraea ceibae TaxID=1935170 RepID=UPI001C5EFB8D|nr:hypothetical protein [Nonomuraea ceibae]
MTNVPSTGRPRTGTFDKLNERLAAHSKTFGLDMSALWREAINSMVDAASTELKWAYADMLAGWEVIRYLLSEETAAKRNSGLRDLLRKVAAAQWDNDERVKFSQVDLDRERLADLFVDVPADMIHVPRRAQGLATDTHRLGRCRLLHHRQVALPVHPRAGSTRSGQVHAGADRLPGVPCRIHAGTDAHI